MLEIKDLVCGYGELAVIHQLSLSVGDRESVAVLGANGAGKSTLMKAASRSLPIMSGSIRWDGADISDWPAWKAARGGIGYVRQDSNVFPELSVLENLDIAASVQRGQKDTDEVLEQFPVLRQRSKQLAGTLSGGERQMLALASALLMKPRILLLDEPTSGLAPVIVATLAHIIRDVIASGVAVVWVVEQEPEIALEVVDRAVVIAGGQVVSEFTGAQLTDRKLLAHLVLGV